MSSTVVDHDARVEEYYEFLAASTAATPAVDPATWLDLDLDRVLARIDRCELALGKQVAYARVRFGAHNMTPAESEHLVRAFAADEAFAAATRRLLSRASRNLGFGCWDAQQYSALARSSWRWAVPGLTLLTIALAGSTVVWPRALLALLLVLVCNALVRSFVLRRAGTFALVMGQAPDLLRLTRKLRAVPALRACISDALQVDPSALSRFARAVGWMPDLRLVDGAVTGHVIEWLNVFLLLDANALVAGSCALSQDHRALTSLAARVGEIDCCLGVAMLRGEPGPWCVPQLTRNSDMIDFRDVWHPLVAQPISNSTRLRLGSGLLVTGSNMSGKTTFLRTIGVGITLGNGLNTAPAREHLGGLVSVCSLIARADDVQSGHSYLFEDVLRIVTMLRMSASGASHVFLLDEPFRGTSAEDRAVASEAVLRTFTQIARTSCVVAAVHDPEIVDRLSDVYQQKCFRVDARGAAPLFDYRLRDGTSRSSTVLLLLEAAGAPHELLEKARELGSKNGTHPPFSREAPPT